MPIPLTTSTELETPPALNTTPGTFVTVDATTKATWANWAALFAAHPPSPGFQYQIGDVDLADWGGAVITNAIGGGAVGNRAAIIYAGADRALHPVVRARDGGGEALVEGIRFNGASASHWYLHGLTWRGHTATENDILLGADVVWDWFLIEDSLRSYGIRLRSGGGGLVVQRGVLRNNLDGSPGSLGIQVDPQGAVPITGVKILDCEIYDYGDSIQVSQSSTDAYVATSGLIDGCEGYLTAARYQGGNLANAENGLDAKSGGAARSWEVRNCRFWGFRSNGVSATGEAVVFHIQANGWWFHDCIFADVPRAVIETLYDDDAPGGNPLPSPDGQDTRRDNEFEDCHFIDVHAFAEEDSDGGGAIVRTANNASFLRCVFARSDSILYIHTTGSHAGGPSFTDCVNVGPLDEDHVDSDEPGVFYVTADNEEATDTGSWDYYERKRWTGPEFALGAIPLTVEAGGGGCSGRRGWRQVAWRPAGTLD